MCHRCALCLPASGLQHSAAVLTAAMAASQSSRSSAARTASSIACQSGGSFTIPVCRSEYPAGPPPPEAGSGGGSVERDQAGKLPKEPVPVGAAATSQVVGP